MIYGSDVTFKHPTPPMIVVLELGSRLKITCPLPPPHPGAIAVIDAYHYPEALNDFNVFAATYGLPQEPSTNPTLASNTYFQQVYVTSAGTITTNPPHVVSVLLLGGGGGCTPCSHYHGMQ